MILVRHHVVPSTKHLQRNEIGGAYLVSYVNQTDDAIAIQMARDEIDEKWRIEDFEGTKIVTRGQYDDADPNLQYFDQALIDDVVSVYHTYPIDEEE